MPTPPVRPFSLSVTLTVSTLAAVFAVVTGPMVASGQTEAESLSASFRKASQRGLPAVVTVHTTGLANRISPLAGIDPFAAPGSRLHPLPRDSGGSGVVIDARKGLVLTNDHVVQGGSSVVVTLPDGRQRPAKEVRHDPLSDLALLVIEPGGLHQADWGDSDTLDTGDWVLAVGQPFGLSGTVTAGIVSGKSRGLGDLFVNEDLIQTDAAINPGNSGGPLVNLKGDVVGINVAFKTLGGGYEGVGFAVPSARARRVATDLAEFGRVRRAYLGVQIESLDPDEAEKIGHPGAVRITGLTAGSAAETAGLQSGDVLVKVKDRPIHGTSGLRSSVEFSQVGEPLELAYIRSGEEHTVQVRPQALPEALVEPPPAQPIEPVVPQGPGLGIVPGPNLDEPPLITRPPSLNLPTVRREQLDARSPTRFPELGLRLDELSPAHVRRFALDPGTDGLVVVGVQPDGPADKAGLEVGMVITDAAHRKVTDLGEFRAAIARRPKGQDLVLRVLKNGRAGFRVILDQTGSDTKSPSRTPAEPAPRDKDEQEVPPADRASNPNR
ncbi:MAG TPA: trypsin-like peptidase domain-containing protein [Isosphaeraceae bacterium]|nr:trypsin-like peptidase domain-containing protein [Isosphaeraceae bacterium]